MKSWLLVQRALSVLVGLSIPGNGDLLGLRVKVTHGRSGGQVALHYSTLDQLDLICQRLSGEPI